MDYYLDGWEKEDWKWLTKKWYLVWQGKWTADTIGGNIPMYVVYRYLSFDSSGLRKARGGNQHPWPPTNLHAVREKDAMRLYFLCTPVITWKSRQVVVLACLGRASIRCLQISCFPLSFSGCPQRTNGCGLRGRRCQAPLECKFTE